MAWIERYAKAKESRRLHSRSEYWDAVTWIILTGITGIGAAAAAMAMILAFLQSEASFGVTIVTVGLCLLVLAIDLFLCSYYCMAAKDWRNRQRSGGAG